MALCTQHRLFQYIGLLYLFCMIALPSAFVQPLPFYKSEKVIVAETWIKNINTLQRPVVLKSPSFGVADFNKAGNGYILHYDNRGIAEYDTLVFSADGEIHAYALKNQFVRTREDFYIAFQGQNIVLDVLNNDESYSNLFLTDIPFEEGVHGRINQNKIRASGLTAGMHYLYYTACDASGHCDESKVTLIVLDSQSQHDTIVISDVLEQKLTLPLPDAQFELIQSTVEHTYPLDDGTFEVYFFRDDFGQNEIKFVSPDGRTLVYQIEFIDKWGGNKLNTGDKVYLHPEKSVVSLLTGNDLWTNIYKVLPHRSDLKVTSLGAGEVLIEPRSGFAGKTHFDYITCAYPRCDTTRVEVYVGHFKPARDEFEIFVDPKASYTIPFYTPLKDYQFHVVDHPRQGTLDVVEGGHSFEYTPGPGFKGNDHAKISYSYKNGNETYKSFHTIRFQKSPYPFRGRCTDCIWPGDTDENGVVDIADIGPIARYIGEKGTARSESPVWNGQWVYPWMNFESKKLHHYDANGDGIISVRDMEVVLDHFGNVHGLFSHPMTWMNVPLVIDRSKNYISPGDEMVFEFKLGDEKHQLYNVTGFSTDVKIEGQELTASNVEVIQDHTNWLKSYQPTISLKAPAPESSVSAGEYRVRSVGVEGYGTALKLKIIVEDEVEGFRTARARSNSVKLIFKNNTIHTESGPIRLPDQIIEIPIHNKPDGKVEKSETMTVFPNPAQDAITVHGLTAKEVVSMEIFDVTGKSCKVFEPTDRLSGMALNVRDLPSGLYILKVETEDAIWNKKITVLR